uniref:CCA tRNA nucleotidyltransferase n=1 Tax=Agathobacter sp. TaxID=2021311 RepID=UPI004056D0F9
MFHLPEDVRFIIDRLTEYGYEAYAVGGCVRDTLLFRMPGDWDITTSAAPEQVKAIFPHTIDTGIEHGTVTVMRNHTGYEVTTYRIDGKYEDARHPKEVTFTASLIEDLKRRDFTINAMAYNDKKGLADEFDGKGDLKQKIIRCVGDPMERFSEDALRMLRAVRFAAQLGFSIEENTKEAIRTLAPAIAKVSIERITAELIKILVSDHPEELKTAYELGLTKIFLPEFDTMMETPQNTKHHMYSVGEHTIETLKNIEADRIMRISMLFHDISKPECHFTDEKGSHFWGHPEKGVEKSKIIMRRLKLDNDTIEKVARMVRYHDERPGLSHPAKVRKLISAVGPEHFPMLLAIKRADTLGQSFFRRAEKMCYIDDLEAFYQDVMDNAVCVRKKDLAINGKDLIAIGMKQGKELGCILEELYQAVLKEPQLNEREKLLELANKLAAPFI